MYIYTSNDKLSMFKLLTKKIGQYWNLIIQNFSLNPKSFIWFFIEVICIVAIGLNISKLIRKENTNTATPLFWLVLCIVSCGFGGPLYFLLEYIFRKRNRNKSYNDINCLGTFFYCLGVFLFFSFGIGFTLFNVENINYDDSFLGYPFIIYSIATILKLLVDYCINKYGEIYFSGDDINIKEIEAAANEGPVRDRLRKSCCYSVDKKELSKYFLEREEETEKYYVFKCFNKNEKKEFVVLKSVFYKDLYAAFAATILIIAFYTPYLFWIVELKILSF